jgi:hypothetical protein
MSTIQSQPPLGRSGLMPPLPRQELLSVGNEFPRGELKPRILSAFWWNWGWPTSFARSPAPVVELSGENPDPEGKPVQLGTWWLLQAGILSERIGADSERLRSYLIDIARTGQNWPRYEFKIFAEAGRTAGKAPDPIVEMTVYREPAVRGGLRVELQTVDGDRLRVCTQQRLAGD